MSVATRSLTPADILRNCRGKAVSVELVNGETINGIVMRTDRTMNVVLKQTIRTSINGDAFWKARECLVRGSSVRTVRFDESVLKIVVANTTRQRKRRREDASHDAKNSSENKIKHKSSAQQKHNEKRAHS